MATLRQTVGRTLSLFAKRSAWVEKKPVLFSSSLFSHSTYTIQCRASSYVSNREAKWEEIEKIPEMKQLGIFREQLSSEETFQHSKETFSNAKFNVPLSAAGVDRETYLRLIRAGMMTFCSHVEARIASFLGEGFYTIGSGGEELMSAVGAVLQRQDYVCLHYRHLGTQFARQLGEGRTMEDILLARARAHTVSAADEVTGGVHCALGGDRHDKTTFIATSTLASQCPPAVGRALGSFLAGVLKIPNAPPKNTVSYVSVGDGSINNAHFVSALNFAQYASYKGFKCPIVFGITDNNLAISLKGQDWLTKGFLKSVNIERFIADGNDLASIYATASKAFAYARKQKKPCIFVVKEVPRRFGHAATDRQVAYLTMDEINQFEDSNPLFGGVMAGIQEGLTTREEMCTMLEEIWAKTEEAFALAVSEPKVTMENLMDRLHRIPLPACDALVETTSVTEVKANNSKKKLVMRRAMNKVIQETLSNHNDMVYIGEDVTHGGYYVVTENLLKQFGPYRVIDFPPEETNLIGSGLGFSQVGICPIVEIPYAKYLDCGYDMFLETIFSVWLSNKAPGMGIIYRMQGFGPGVFGGNHHTTNLIPLPPGLDVVCYSNGYDYVRGWRFLVKQAREGRMVMTVDSTNLLNKYHCFDKDDLWRRTYPDNEKEELHFHTVIRYNMDPSAIASASEHEENRNVLLVSYGNGVSESLLAAEELAQIHGLNVTVVDTPLLSEVPDGLRHVLQADASWDCVIFADECKHGQHPYGGMVCKLQEEKLLPPTWRTVTAAPTYNPLGHLMTFLNKDKILKSTRAALSL
eukprot:m.20037 g.20037  ORF g.20037 m.20037 type:complete len:807 (+) comp5207_c0_seq1:104-2524(+)